ncbi:MAG: ROK family protein [Clostridia bacterium]
MPQTPNQQVKQQNLHLVRMLLYAHSPATKAQLAALSGLSVVTLGSLIAQLRKTGEVLEDALLPSDGGRPARAYRLNGDYAHALTLFVLQKNGEYMLYRSVCDLMGKELQREETVCLAALHAQIPAVAASCCQADPQIRVIAIGIPGQAMAGTVRFCDAPGLVGTPLQTLVQAQTGCRVLIENDMNAAAYGFACRTLPKEDECTVGMYFPLCKGPGAGILLGSRMLRGKLGMSGELGALPHSIDWEHPPAPFEQVISDCVQAVTAVLAPERVIIYREGLNLAALESCMNRCWAELPIRPELVTTEALAPDYALGMRRLALDLLLPPITKRSQQP